MDTLRGPAGLPGCLAGRAPSPGALPQCEGNEKNGTFARLPHFFFTLRTACRPGNAQPPHARPVAGNRHRRDGQYGPDDPEQKARSGNPQRKYPVQTAPRKPFQRPPRESNGETGAETQTPEKKTKHPARNTTKGPQPPPQQKATTNRPERYRNATKKLSLLRQPLRPCHRNCAGRYAARRRAIARSSTADSPAPPRKTPRQKHPGAHAPAAIRLD